MRAFEAAARLNSFVAAAEELSVTPGAVSQHVRTLEAWIDVPLFRRNARGVELTSTGRALLPEFEAAFDALGAATQALRNHKPMAEFHIAALPSVAQLWLPARLGRIRGKMPELKVSVTAMEAPPNLDRELFDLALFYQPPDTSSGQIEIEKDEIFPVCAPALAARIGQERALDRVQLLQDQTWKDDWAIWSAAAGVPLQDPDGGARFSLYSLAIEEAKAGAGVLMGHAGLVRDALRDGSLVAPFRLRCQTGRSLVITLPARHHANPNTRTVVDLLKDQPAPRDQPS